MVVQMISPQIREDRTRKINPLRPPLLQRMRTYFHRCHPAPVLPHLRQKLLEIQRLRSGLLRGNSAFARVVPHRAQKPTTQTPRLEKRLNQHRRRCFPIRSRQTNHLNLFARMPIEIGRHPTQRATTIFNPNIRPRYIHHLFLHHHRHRSPLHRIRNKGVTIFLLSLPRTEKRSRRHLGRFIGQSRHLRLPASLPILHHYPLHNLRQLHNGVRRATTVPRFKFSCSAT